MENRVAFLKNASGAGVAVAQDLLDESGEFFGLLANQCPVTSYVAGLGG